MTQQETGIETTTRIGTGTTDIDVKSFEEVRQYTINYFAIKLKTKFLFLKKIIYCTFAVLSLDYFLMALVPSIFFNIINVISISILLFTSYYSLYVFKHAFEVVSYKIYRQTIKVIFTLIASLVIYYSDMFYILIFKILYQFTSFFPLFERSFLEIFFGLFFFFVYLLLNLLFPIIILFKLFQVRDSVKNVGKAKGEDYDAVPTQDSDTPHNSIEIKQ